jgi:hypothetical protein
MTTEQELVNKWTDWASHLDPETQNTVFTALSAPNRPENAIIYHLATGQRALWLFMNTDNRHVVVTLDTMELAFINEFEWMTEGLVPAKGN